MYSDEDYMYEEEQEYLPEVNVFERVEYEGGDTVEQIAMDAGVIPDDRKKGTKFTNNVWRFYVYVNATARRMIDEGSIPLRPAEVPRILRQIKMIPNPEFKNPEAFIYGYAVTKSGTLDRNMLKTLTLPPTLKLTDVVRYARMILLS